MPFSNHDGRRFVFILLVVAAIGAVGLTVLIPARPPEAQHQKVTP